jgi:putative phage-type endonuclease
MGGVYIMSVKIIKPKSREEWLEHRKNGIGSSEVASILGLNPFETPYQLWRRKMGLDPAKDETFAMKAGHYLEDAVSLFWADETGREVIKASAGDWLFVNDAKPFLQVSPDRTFWVNSESKKNMQNKGILECKTTQKQIDADDLPKHWFCQIQYQLGVSEFQQGSLAWLSSWREFGYRDIEFVPDFYGWMIDEVARFWVDNIICGQEPDSVSVEDVIKKYSRHTDGKIIETTEEILQAYTELKEVKEELKALDEKKDALEEKIKLYLGDAEAVSYGGRTLATWKAAKDSEKFDSKLFCKEHPELERQYTITVPGSRRFLLK